jgi:AraC-like DNA-binding protein
MRDAYVEHRPAPDIATHVACTWTRVVGGGATEPVIPDACVDVIVVGDEAPHIAGPADRTVWVALPAGTMLHGIRFRPGAARDILRTDLDELRNAHVELAAVARAPLIDPRAPRTSLEQWTRTRLARSRGDTSAIEAARALIGATTIDDVADELGWGARRLHRRITAACGYSPKILHRVLRLQRALRIAHAGERSLASLAAAAGYADQAHMTREFTALTGLPPARYLALADPRVGRWLVSDLFKTSGVRGAKLSA